MIANSTHIGWCIFKRFLSNEGIGAFVASVVAPDSLLNLFVFNQPVWRISMWYINALLAVLVIIYFIEKWYGDLKKVYFLIPILLVFNILLGTYSFVLPGNERFQLCYSRNFLFCGIPYFLLGSYVHHNKEKVCRLFGKWYSAVLFGILGCVELYILELLGLQRFIDHTALTCFLSLSVFCFFVKAEFRVGNLLKRVSGWGRKYSFVVYVTHSIVIEIFTKVINYANNYTFVANLLTWFGPILVLLISTFWARCLYCCKDYIKAKKARNWVRAEDAYPKQDNTRLF